MWGEKKEHKVSKMFFAWTDDALRFEAKTLKQIHFNFEGAPIITALYTKPAEYLQTLVPTSVHPNSITLVGYPLELLTFVLVLLTSHTSLFANILIWVLIYVGLVIDCMDGHHARKTKQCSAFGDCVDKMHDNYMGVTATFQLIRVIPNLYCRIIVAISILLGCFLLYDQASMTTEITADAHSDLMMFMPALALVRMGFDGYGYHQAWQIVTYLITAFVAISVLNNVRKNFLQHKKLRISPVRNYIAATLYSATSALSLIHCFGQGGNKYGFKTLYYAYFGAWINSVLFTSLLQIPARHYSIANIPFLLFLALCLYENVRESVVFDVAAGLLGLGYLILALKSLISLGLHLGDTYTWKIFGSFFATSPHQSRKALSRQTRPGGIIPDSVHEEYEKKEAYLYEVRGNSN